jgi:two-component system sensor histidine kinase SenX3
VILVVLAVGAVVLGAVGVGMVLGRRRAAREASALAARLDGDAVLVDDLHGALVRIERRVGEQAAALERAVDHEDRIRTALDALPIGVVLAAADGWQLRNRVAEQLLGVRHADALIDEAVQAKVASALAGESRRRELDLHGPPRRKVVVTGFPVGDGEPATALVVVEDVSERARLEAMRTDFVANISHELRTPVGAMALLAETLHGERDVELLDRLSSKLVSEAHRLTRTIEDLLELSKIEVGDQPLKSVVEVGEVVDDSLDRVRHLAEERRVRVGVDPLVRRVTVIGDRNQLVSAIANLIENAIKYSDPGSAVTVTADVAGSWVELSIEDHGIGIPARDLDRIFERFYRVDKGRGRDTGGTGLGLAIVRHVATNHGGSVTVRSEEGIGSTFTLRVPAGPGTPLLDEYSEAS